MATASRQNRRPTIRRQFRREERTFYVAYAALVACTLFVLLMMFSYGPQIGPPLFLLIVVVGMAMVRPALALGVAIVLTTVGDARAMHWWPVVKNLSGRDSALFIADGLTISPLEIVLLTVVVVWLVARQLGPRSTPPLVYGPLWRPLLLFSLFLAFGMAWGLGRGGNLRVAVFEVRPLIAIPLVYLAATNLFTSLQHYRRLLWGIVAALTVEAVHGLLKLSTIRDRWPDGMSPVEHTAALHMNLLLLLLVGSLWFGTNKPGKRPLLFLLAVPTLMLYLEAERRSAVVGLIIGGVYLAIVLFARNRKTFLRVIPIMALIGIAYVGAFWNAESSQLGFPAQAVRIIVQPGAATETDAASDLYRQIENFDLSTTVRSSPITGIGFGQPFLRPIPLPDISSFEFWAYIPHNSILWMWTQVGIVGFVAFLYIFGLGTAIGIRAAERMRDPDDATLVAVVGAYIPMVLVVAFVEITFDIQTTVLLGVALALVGSAERLAGLPSLDGASDAADEASDAPAVERTATALGPAGAP